MKTLFTILALALALTSFSQDIIAFANGDTLTGKITGLNDQDIYLKTDDGRTKFKLMNVKAYRHQFVWFYANGDRMDAGNMMLNKGHIEPASQIATYLTDAGTTMQVGVMISIILGVAAFVVDDSKTQVILGGASGVVFCGTLIITGSKLKMAGNVYGLK